MVRVWRRRVLEGVGMAVIVPGMLLASLAVLAVAGGFGALSALGEALSGPSLPAFAIVASHGGGPSAGRAVSPALVAALSASASPSRAAGGAGSLTTGGGATAEGGPRTLTGPTPRQPGKSGQALHSEHIGSTPPAPRPQSTVVDRVVSAGTAVTSQLPGPAGPAATEALQAAGSTLDSIAPIKSP